MNTISKLADKLSDPEYRKAFVASQINLGIPFQLRAMLKNRDGWTQETLAQRADMLQPRISGLMTPGKTRPNIETLRRIAEAFDCALIVRFAPFSELGQWSEEFDPDSFNVPSFADDPGFIAKKPIEAAYAMPRRVQAELISHQLNSPPPFEPEISRGNLLVMQPRGQSIAQQGFRQLASCAGINK